MDRRTPHGCARSVSECDVFWHHFADQDVEERYARQRNDETNGVTGAFAQPR